MSSQQRSQATPTGLEPITLGYVAAAAYLGVPVETLRSWCKAGRFQRVRIGRRSLVLKREIDNFIKAQLEEGDE